MWLSTRQIQARVFSIFSKDFARFLFPINAEFFRYLVDITDLDSTRDRDGTAVDVDLIMTPFEFNVCEVLFQSSKPAVEDAVASTILDSNSLNQQNASAAKRIYSLLQPDEMRLLKLYRGIVMIKCPALVTHEGAAPKYEALSSV